MTITQQTISQTNLRLEAWYKEVKLSYNVIGEARTRVDEDVVTIEFIEDGIIKTWSMAFYPEYTLENGLDYVFNCWAEMAR